MSATECGISRADQDAFALQSQLRAAAAIAAGAFKEEIVPVEIATRKGTVIFDTDEHPKATTLEKLAALKPAFLKGGSVTAGNASGINDGAAALVIAREEAAMATGVKPLARIRGFAVAGVRPEVMGLGPIPAVRLLCERTGLTVTDFDVIESRLKARKGHFFKTQMLVTQFETLQEPGADESDVLIVDIDQPLEGVVASTIEVINKGSH